MGFGDSVLRRPNDRQTTREPPLKTERIQMQNYFLDFSLDENGLFVFFFLIASVRLDPFDFDESNRQAFWREFIEFESINFIPLVKFVVVFHFIALAYFRSSF